MRKSMAPGSISVIHIAGSAVPALQVLFCKFTEMYWGLAIHPMSMDSLFMGDGDVMESPFKLLLRMLPHMVYPFKPIRRLKGWPPVAFYIDYLFSWEWYSGFPLKSRREFVPLSSKAVEAISSLDGNAFPSGQGWRH